VRRQLSLAYLLARAADTVADTEVIARPRRRALLESFRIALPDRQRCQDVATELMHEVEGRSSVAKENALLARLDLLLQCLHGFSPGDLDASVRVLSTLITGMERDIDRHQVETLDELDDHTYFAAGCVGEYWTEITYANLPALHGGHAGPQIHRGVRLGKGLQYVNVLRDIPADLGAGRCYLPRELMRTFELKREDLQAPEARRRARPALRYLEDVAANHFDAGWAYVEALPAREVRLRVAVILPLWIGLETLAALRAADDPLDPGHVIKVPRRRIYLTLFEAVASARFSPIMRQLHRLRRQASA
jgi:farnesyl-diphosphate farnesyltransferase